LESWKNVPENKGRGALSNPSNRFEERQRQPWVDDLPREEDPTGSDATRFSADQSRSVISVNDSPDIPFDQSINPYRGCEHGCIYCYARPSHAHLGFSPGKDFETEIVYKPDAASLLERELGRPGYRCQPLALGANTDAYQPVERRLRITRHVIEVLCNSRHPLLITTKSALVERDLDLLGQMATQQLVQVQISVSTLDARLARRLEPRAASPLRRIETLKRLSDAGIPTAVLVAPVIPGLTEHELERILKIARSAGAASASYVLLRLPLEVQILFQEWLEAHAPDRAERILGLVRDMRSGDLNDARFHYRMRGTGPVADMIRQRFALAHEREGYSQPPGLRCDEFRPPNRDKRQLELF